MRNHNLPKKQGLYDPRFEHEKEYLALVEGEPDDAALAKLRAEHDPWVIFDTPYRLGAVLDDMRAALEPERRVVVACDLTCPRSKSCAAPCVKSAIISRRIYNH
jgi:16S rRNA C1402 (ribose-2'-O) methylase RsmI